MLLFLAYIYDAEERSAKPASYPSLPFTSLFLACSYNNECQRESSEYVSSTKRD